MRAYDFSKRGKLTLYEYLYRCLKEDILEGKIAAGEKLPSKRELAGTYGSSVKTVENAYAQLLAEGYIYSIPKKGYYAADIAAGAIPSPAAPAPKPVTEQKEETYFADFTSSQTHPDTFPFSIWAK